MEKETSIFNDLKEIINADAEIKDKLTSVTEYIYKVYGLKSYFCRLYAQRWAFFAGNNDIYLSVKHFKLSKEWGLIIEDNDTDDELYENIVEGLIVLLNIKKSA